jgi:hypothetical protein
MHSEEVHILIKCILLFHPVQMAPSPPGAHQIAVITLWDELRVSSSCRRPNKHQLLVIVDLSTIYPVKKLAKPPHTALTHLFVLRDAIPLLFRQDMMPDPTIWLSAVFEAVRFLNTFDP